MNRRVFFTVFAGVFFVFAGCSTDSEEPSGYEVNIAFQDDVDGINAAFASQEPVINEVYLSRDLAIYENDILIIPPGKTLYLKGKKIIFNGFGNQMGGIIVASHAGAIDFSDWSPDRKAKAGDEGITDDIPIDMSEYGILIADSDFIAKNVKNEDDTQNFIKVKDDDANMVKIGDDPKNIGDDKSFKADLVSDNSTVISTIPSGVTDYYVLTPNTSSPVTLDFSNKGSLENLTVTGSVKIKNIPEDFGGSLLVAGDILDDTGELTIACSVEARAARFSKKVTFKKTIDFLGPNSFGGDVVFDGASSITSDNSTLFKENVEIKGASYHLYISNSVFEKVVTVSGTGSTNINNVAFKGGVVVENGATLSITDNSNSPAANITVKKGGNVIYNVNTNFNLNNAKTVGGSDVNLIFEGQDKLSITSTGGGTLDLSNSNITLTDNGSLVLGGSTAIILGGGGGSLAAASYKIAGAGTLFSSLAATTFTKNKIEGDSTKTPVLTFSGGGNNSFLNLPENGCGTLSRINVDLRNGGTITFGRAGMLYLAPGGSITTGDDAANLAPGGLIAAGSLAASGGSLLAGSFSLDGTASASIQAGSLGTSAANFIVAGDYFAKVTGELSGSVARTLPVNGDGGSASAGGSILIFKN
jgi:hypothetical protein